MKLKKQRDYSFGFSAGFAPSVAAGSFFFGPATIYVSLPPRAVRGARYWVSMVRHFVGHTSTQEEQTTQRMLSICHVFSLTSTQIAPVGHFRWQDRQVIHPSGLIETWPRESAVFLAGFAGYIRVDGRLNRLLMTILVFWKKVIAYHRSAQPTQGSIDRTITGTSASSQPLRSFTSGGMFVNVGVRTRCRTRFFFPLPLI